MNVHEMACKVNLLLDETPGIDVIALTWSANQHILTATLTGPGAVDVILAMPGAETGEWYGGRNVRRHDSMQRAEVEVWRQRSISAVVDGIRYMVHEVQRESRLVPPDEVTVNGAPLADFIGTCP
jgi:hypothetical protein